MSSDKYERGRQHLNVSHQRITYKKKTKQQQQLTLRLTQNSSVEKNKMIVMMTMMIETIMTKEKWFLARMSNASIKCKSLTKK